MRGKNVKIAIDTIVEYSNYGNRLQNYALQKVLENQGHEVITLKNYTHVEADEPKSVRIKRLLREGHFIDKSYRKIVKKWKGLRQSKKYNALRVQNFVAFTNTYIHESNYEINQDTTDFSFDEDIDCYVVGSDQVWNCNFSRFSSFDFISFSTKPRISYAASFGINDVPDKFVPAYKTGLNTFDDISVREEAGKRLVEQMSDKNAEVVLDPTLLLSPTEWLSLAVNRKEYTEKYILVYFLGSPTRKDKQYIKQYAKKRHLQVKQLVTYADLDLWVADPAEFINLFSQAEAIFTDSFHACVFSIMFDKYFEAFTRHYDGPSMNSRLETLFRDLGLEERWHRNDSNYQEIDYVKVKERLAQRQRESMQFLTRALSAIER